MYPQTRKIVGSAFFGALWVGALCYGLGALDRYENTPGSSGIVPEQWPVASHISRSNDRCTLVMMAHPRCPCTRASVNELAQIMARGHGQVDAFVLFYKPRNGGTEWDETELRQTAAAIPGVTVLTDIDGEEAEHFGGETSGHTVLFDRNGRRLFSGGITGSRGHAGDNIGEGAVQSFIKGQPAGQHATLVFGCSLGRRMATKGNSCPH